MSAQLYRVITDSVYDEANACYTSMYWTLNNFIKLRSLYKFFKNDIVEIKDITDNVVDIFPVFNAEEHRDDAVRCLVMVSPTVPLNINADYTFSSKDSDILLTVPVEHNDNKSYILLVGVPIGVRSIVAGQDVNTRDRLEFIVESRQLSAE